jgi:hypothetical protein
MIDRIVCDLHRRTASEETNKYLPMASDTRSERDLSAVGGN